MDSSKVILYGLAHRCLPKFLINTLIKVHCSDPVLPNIHLILTVFMLAVIEVNPM